MRNSWKRSLNSNCCWHLDIAELLNCLLLMKALGNKPKRHNEAVVKLLNSIFITISSGLLFFSKFLVMSLCSVSIQTLPWVPWQWGQLEPVPCVCETPRGSSVLKCSVPALVLKALRCATEASGVQCNIGLWWSWGPVLGSTTKSDLSSDQKI